jgi:hypothetical protein
MPHNTPKDYHHHTHSRNRQADYNAIRKQLRTAGHTGRERGIPNANLAKAKVRLQDAYNQQPTPATLSKSCTMAVLNASVSTASTVLRKAKPTASERNKLRLS